MIRAPRELIANAYVLVAEARKLIAADGKHRLLQELADVAEAFARWEGWEEYPPAKRVLQSNDLVVDDWTPASTNELFRGTYKQRFALAERDRLMVMAAANRTLPSIPEASGPRRVSLELSLAPRMRRKDRDAYWKSTLDALKHAKLLVDDSANWCDTGAVRFRRLPAPPPTPGSPSTTSRTTGARAKGPAAGPRRSAGGRSGSKTIGERTLKALFNRLALLESFQDAARATNARGVKPVLQDVLLDAPSQIDGRSSTLTGTNLELAIRRDILGVKVDEPGQVMLPAKRLGPVLKSSQDQQLLLETGAKGTLRVKSLTGRWEFATLPVKEYPAPESNFPKTGYRVVSSAELIRGLNRTKIATQVSKHFALAGVLFEFEENGAEGKLHLAALDGKCISYSPIDTEIEGHVEPHPPRTTVVPDEAVKFLLSHLQPADPPVHIHFEKNEVFFRTDRAVISARLLEGRYPNWRVALPQLRLFKAELGAGPLALAIEQARVTTSEESCAIRIRFEDGWIRFRSESSDIGKSQIDIEVPGMKPPEEFENSYIPEQLLDFLKTVKGDTRISVEFTAQAMAGAGPILLETPDKSQFGSMPLEAKKE